MTEPTSPDAARRPLMVGLLVLVTAIAFEAQSVSTAMPAAGDDLGRLDLYAWAFTAFMIPQIIAIVAGGRLSDRIGPVRPLKAGVATFAVGIVVSATAVSMQMLLAGRFIQGFGGGLANVTLMVVVGRAFPPSETARVMTWFSFAWMLPSFVGPSLAAWIVRISSWHFVFWVILPVVAAGIIVLGPALSKIPMPGLGGEDAEQAPLWAAVCVAAGVAMAQAAGTSGPLWGTIMAVAGLALLVVGTPRLMPVGWRPAGRGMPAVIGVRFASTGAFSGALAFLPLMVTHLRHLDLMAGGLVITVASLGWTFGSWLQSRPWLRISRDAILTWGTALTAFGLSASTVCTVLAWIPLPVLVVVMTIAGTGMGMMMSSTSILVMQLSAAEELGRTTSSVQVGESMGNALVVGLSGAVFAALSSSGQEAAAYAWQSAIVAAVACLSVAISRRLGHVENLSARPRVDAA